MTVRALDACFHCGEPLAGSTLTIESDGRKVPVCCHGCAAVATMIAASGLTDYYRFRTGPADRPDSATLAADTWSAYAQPEIACELTRTQRGVTSVTLAIDGLRCAACSWLIERTLLGMGGVVEATANAATGRAHVAWREDRLTLADVMRTIAQVGLRPRALERGADQRVERSETRDALKRLMVAGFGMMQVMMFAVAVYAAELAHETMAPELLTFFRAVSLIVSTPVMFYAGAPLLAAAWRAIAHRTVAMEVPAAIALILAYGASVWNTWRGSGTVYFDSVTMFVFFLTLSRYVQTSLRHRSTRLSEALAHQLPQYAHVKRGDDLVDVPVTALRAGDTLLVRSGEVIPADGRLAEGTTQVDEAILTGESRLVGRAAGDALLGGTINGGGPIYMSVTAAADGTFLSHLVALLRRAQAQRPAFATAADAAAGRFLRYVAVAACATWIGWLAVDATRAFEATLAVLVVACPCAFAIAMPAAVSAASAHLAERGLVIVQPQALERLARIDRFVFDKTGTLTRGTPEVRRCVAFGELTPGHCLAIAAALELASEHPLARAFARIATPERANAVTSTTGAGLEGSVAGVCYRIGTAAFVAGLHPTAAPAPPIESTGTLVYLGDERGPLAAIELVDMTRPDAGAAVAALREIGIEAQILSGDGADAVAATARDAGIATALASSLPQAKLDHVAALEAAGHRIAMIGDGVNDAPVLARASVSIAMGRGAPLAHASADMVLIGERLTTLPDAVAIARKTLRVARQNLAWSAAYNLACLPLAAFGFVPPWLAAIGMSASSLGVVINAMRLLPPRGRRT